MSSEKKTKSNIKVFTDGSCMNNRKTKEIKCGYGIYFPDGESSNVDKKFTLEPLTNQRTELYAIYKAIKIIDKKYNFDKLTIYSDSQYSINCVTNWIKTWKANGWMTANKKEVLNQDIIKKIDKLMLCHVGKIKFIHVRAHTGKQDEFSIANDIVDKLAKDGANS